MTRFDAWTVAPDAADFVGGDLREAAGGVVAYPMLSADSMRALLGALRASRDALLSRPVTDLAASLGAVGRRLTTEGDPLRDQALTALPSTAGISPAMARLVLDGMARDWSEERLASLLDAEFADPTVLDGFQSGRHGGVRALGPPLTLHIGAGTVAGVSVTSLVRALLVKSAVLVKPGLGDVVLPNLFLRGLQEADPELAAAAAVLYWPGGAEGPEEGGAEDAALAEADAVIVYGGDETVASVRARMPASGRLLAYHHRVSLGLLGADALTAVDSAREAAAAVARAVATFDQRGCVSPHVVYVEQGGDVSPSEWAGLLADAMRAVELELPSGPLSPEEASDVHQVRGAAELRSAAGEGVEVYVGDDAPWTVIFESDPAFLPSCLNRVVRVKPLHALVDVVDYLGGLGRHLQTAAVAGVGADEGDLREALARAGVLRITSFEEAPWPPPWWHHDGMGPLAALVRWIDSEA